LFSEKRDDLSEKKAVYIEIHPAGQRSIPATGNSWLKEEKF
jgi:hypothetical protein